jgi:signal transduction histidine kinase
LFYFICLNKPNDATSITPIVILSGNTDESLALEGVKQGAQDYLIKGSFNHHTLPRILFYAIERKRMEIFKDDFCSLVSHELRAPLSVIMGAIDGIKNGTLGPLTEKQEKVLGLASKNSHRLAKIITNILSLSRYESGRAVLNPTEIDIKTLSEESFALFQEDAEKSNLKFENDFAANLPRVLGDTDLLLEVFNNLVSNAIRFAKTKVKISAKPAENAILDKAFSKHEDKVFENYILITVTDDGQGIPANQFKDLFNKFVQLGRKTGGTHYKGTGLGLSICKTIVTLLKGKIWVESEIGVGTKFHFLLPVAKM